MAIDLFNIKLNGDYDFIQDSIPSGTGTWLVSETFISGDTYTKGESYNVVSGTPTRIEETEDFKIDKVIYPTIQSVCEWLNNYFYVARQGETYISDSPESCLPISVDREWTNYISVWGNYTFASGDITVIERNPFKSGDLVQIKQSLRNNLVSYSTLITDGINIDNDLSVDTTEDAIIFLMFVPSNVENIISAMIYYDIYTRGEPSNLKSENIGNYSYSKDNTEMIKIGYLDYPSSLISGLQQYKKVRFVQ